MIGREVTLPAMGDVGPTPCWAATPAGATRGMVVIHEALGRQPEIERVVERFAALGYAAIMPDLFCDGVRAACIVRMTKDISRGAGPSFDRARGCRDWLVSEAKLEPKRVGLIGFCLGGGFVLVAGGGFGAVSTNYGVVPDELPHDIGPIIGCYGGRDVAFRGQSVKLQRVAKKAGKQGETHMFPTVGHSFLTDGRHRLSFLSYPILRIRYDAGVAAEGWAKIDAFLDQHLV